MEETEGSIGFKTQKELLEATIPLLPEGAQIRLKGNIGVIHDPSHDEPWIIAMSAKPGYMKTLEYSGCAISQGLPSSPSRTVTIFLVRS